MKSVFQPFPTLAGRRVQAWNYQAAYRRPRHFHEEPEFNLVTRGRGVIEVGERKLDVHAGSLIWFPPGLDHYLASASADFELVTAGFQPTLLDAFAREHSISVDFARSEQQLLAHQAEEISTVLSQAHQSMDPQSVERQSLQILQQLMQLRADQGSQLGHRAAALIISHPGTSRDRLARLVSSNRGDVSRRFHSDHGTTLRQYRNVLRTLAFIRLSMDGEESLTRAAIKAGFGSYSQCHRVFRALMGLSPRDFMAARETLGTLVQFEPLGDPAPLTDSSLQLSPRAFPRQSHAGVRARPAL